MIRSIGDFVARLCHVYGSVMRLLKYKILFSTQDIRSCTYRIDEQEGSDEPSHTHSLSRAVGSRLLVSFHNVCDALHYILANIVITFGSPGRVAQSVVCLTADTRMTADPWVTSSISALSHTFVEIDCPVYKNKDIDIVKFVKHFLPSTTDTKCNTVKLV